MNLEPNSAGTDRDLSVIMPGAEPFFAVHQLIKLAAVVRADLPQIKQPALVFGAKDGWVVDQRDHGLIFEKIGSEKKELVRLGSIHST